VHFSDTHLGFNDLDVLNEANINQREADFYDAFSQVETMRISDNSTSSIFKNIHISYIQFCNKIKFLSFDKVFGSQDEGRRMEILEAFHTIKEQYRQIFLISHEMEIKEMFERVVEL
jgi:hypothetical protein